MCTNVTHESTGLVFNLDLRRTLKTNLISNVQHIFTRMLWGRNKGPQTKFCAIFSLNVHNPIFLLIVQSNKLTVTFYIKEFDWRSRTRLQRSVKICWTFEIRFVFTFRARRKLRQKKSSQFKLNLNFLWWSIFTFMCYSVFIRMLFLRYSNFSI